MCGIFGCAQNNLNLERLRVQLNTLSHRGPDDAGLWLHPRGIVALGSRRLAIQDLSAAGHMPMQHHTHPVWIVFNGEIYNFLELRDKLAALGHRFYSRTDTEVIIAAYLQWGTSCLEHLNGMFGFALYDGRSSAGPDGKLFLARDRAGEKPLYYSVRAEGIVFASELKALIADPAFPRRLDLSAFNAYLAMGHVPGPMCILKDVLKLPPAHALLYDCASRQFNTWCYWTTPARQIENRTVSDQVDQLETLLLESVRQRLIADVPVGIFLSGGLDSSLVTAMAARASAAPVKTYTITFPGYQQVDEARFARRVAEWFGTDHTELAAEPTTVNLLPHLMHFYDEPLADSSIIPTYLVSKLTRQQVTVALGGDGGDELFGGYNHYRSVLRRQKVNERVPQTVRGLAAKGIAFMPLGMKGRNFLSGLRKGLAENMIYSVRAGFFEESARRHLLSQDCLAACNGSFGAPEAYLFGLWPQAGGTVEQMTRLDFLNYLPDAILVKVDRASMAVSLETRAPWLDQHIIEFAFRSVPDDLKIHDNHLKILPRLLAQRLLPPDLDLERKQGFGLPLDPWLRGTWQPLVRETLNGLDTDLFDQSYVQRLLRSHEAGVGVGPQLFALTIFGLWQKLFKVSAA